MDAEHVRFVITDEGAGFDHSNLPDPTDPANLLSSHGRGILMTRIYMDEVSYNPVGNQVTLVRRKKRDAP
jgi:anti-sigma regulatory factor (Ser/Thr protein kinase)